MDNYEALKRYFGHAQFRPGQSGLVYCPPPGTVEPVCAALTAGGTWRLHPSAPAVAG